MKASCFLAVALLATAWLGGFEQVVHAQDAAAPKAAVPTVRDITKAAKLVDGLYGQEIAKAKTASQKLALAKTLRAAANGEQKDLAGKYALYLRSKDFACEAGDLYAAFAVIDDLCNAFAANDAKLKSDAIAVAYGSLVTPADGLVFVNDAFLLSQDALESGEIELARRTNTTGMTAASHMNNRELMDEMSQQSRDLKELAPLATHLPEARALLARNPDDLDANQEVGEFECLVKGNWTAGLPLLARGDDRVLRSLAKADLNRAGNETAVGDGWYEYADKLNGIEKRNALLRARKWYTAALAIESGLTKAKVSKRLDELSGVVDLPHGMDSFVLVALIDGESELHLTPEGIYWQEHEFDKPGRAHGVNLPTYLDEVPWMPEWGKPGEHGGDDTTALLPITLGDLNFDVEVLAVGGDEHLKNPLALKDREQRDPVTISTASGEQVISIPDTQLGCAWYKIRIFRKPSDPPHGG